MAAMVPSTRWSLIARANSRDSIEARRALEELCAAYWRPLHAFARRGGATDADAEDLVQSFLSAFTRPGAFEAVTAERGRFRSYLLGAFKHFVAHERAAAGALKRGGGWTRVPLQPETLGVEHCYASSDAVPGPELAYDECWAFELLDRCFARLSEEYTERGRAALFEALRPTLLEGPSGGYDALAERLQMRPGALRVAAHRLRRRFAELLRAEVAETVRDTADIEDELRHLVEVLRRKPAEGL